MKIQNSQVPIVLPSDHPLRKAAEGMEANFLKEMIRNMRNTVQESEEDKNNKGLQVFRGMLDDEYAETAARNNGIGLSEIIIRQVLEMEQDRLQRQNSVPVRAVNENDLLKK